MNAKIKKVITNTERFKQEKAANIASLEGRIASEEAALEKANAEILAATDADSYADAKDRARRLENVLEFYRGALREANLPMSETELNEGQSTIHKVVSDAADKFKKRADAIAEELAAAYAEFEAVANEADEAAVELYKAAGETTTYINHKAKRYRREEQRDLFCERVPDPTYVTGYRYNPVDDATWNLLKALKGW